MVLISLEQSQGFEGFKHSYFGASMLTTLHIKDEHRIIMQGSTIKPGTKTIHIIHT